MVVVAVVVLPIPATYPTLILNKRKYYMPVVERENKLVKFLKPKNMVLVFVGVLVIAALAWGYWNYLRPVSVKNVCSPAVLQEASTLLNPEQVSRLEATAKNIQNLRGYEKDVNCLYVVTTYYINRGDLDNSQLYLGKLNDVYVSGTGFSSDLKIENRDKKFLSDNVQFLKGYAEETSKNARGSATP